MKTQTQTIEVPYGYRIKPESNKSGMKITFDLEKIKPRRIVLEETDEDTNQIQQYFEPGFTTTLKKVWREVKETDEPQLSLTKKDMLELIEHIKLGGQLNPKIAEFIKENS